MDLSPLPTSVVLALCSIPGCYLGVAADESADTEQAGDTSDSGDTGESVDTEAGTEGDTDPAPTLDACASGQWWDQGDKGSKEMHPGHDCVACHTALDKGPELSIAGTVYTTLHEPDDCRGVEGVTVQITDAMGVVHELRTSPSGNFHLEDREIALPYRAAIVSPGGRIEMATPQSIGSCGTCHTALGANAAPGRILAPATPPPARRRPSQ